MRVFQNVPSLGLAAVTLVLLGSQPVATSQELLNQKALSLPMAQAIAQAALDKCHADGFHVSVTVLDGAGQLKAFLSDDGAAIYSIDFSHRKAYTSYIYRHPSSETAKSWELKPPVLKVEGTIGAAGGMPIKDGDHVIGAVGVAGAPGGEKDEACAAAAIAKFADKL